MPKRIPISAARSIAKEYNCRQVILLAYDNKRVTHIITYGKSIEDCSQAAAGGNMLKEKWGWPECNDQPSRVIKLRTALNELIEAIASEEDQGARFGPAVRHACSVGEVALRLK